MKGSGVVFMHGEGISTPHVRPKGRQPLIECANMDQMEEETEDENKSLRTNGVLLRLL